MSKDEREAYAALFSSMLMATLFYLWISGGMTAGTFDGPPGVQAWARQVLKLIGLGILTTILAHIAVAILHAAITQEANEDLSDERDRAIKARGMQVTLVVISIGFLSMIGLLAWGKPVLVGLNLLLVGCVLGEFLGSLARIYLYRRGG